MKYNIIKFKFYCLLRLLKIVSEVYYLVDRDNNNTLVKYEYLSDIPFYFDSGERVMGRDIRVETYVFGIKVKTLMEEL